MLRIHPSVSLFSAYEERVRKEAVMQVDLRLFWMISLAIYQVLFGVLNGNWLVFLNFSWRAVHDKKRRELEVVWRSLRHSV